MSPMTPSKAHELPAPQSVTSVSCVQVMLALFEHTPVWRKIRREMLTPLAKRLGGPRAAQPAAPTNNNPPATSAMAFESTRASPPNVRLVMICDSLFWKGTVARVRDAGGRPIATDSPAVMETDHHTDPARL